MIHETLTSLLALIPMVDVPPITPTFDGPGAVAAIRIVGQICGYGFLAAVVGLIISAGLVAIGHHFKAGQMQKSGLAGIVGSIAGAAVLGGVTAIIQFGANIQLF